MVYLWLSWNICEITHTRTETSVRWLRLLLLHQLRNSRLSLCKSATKIVFWNKSASVFGLDNQQGRKSCFTKICRRKRNKKTQHNLRENGIRLQTLDPEFTQRHFSEIRFCSIACKEFDELLLCILCNVFYSDCEWTSGKCKRGVRQVWKVWREFGFKFTYQS